MYRDYLRIPVRGFLSHLRASDPQVEVPPVGFGKSRIVPLHPTTAERLWPFAGLLDR
jgi:hypothetical protein